MKITFPEEVPVLVVGGKGHQLELRLSLRRFALYLVPLVL